LVGIGASNPKTLGAAALAMLIGGMLAGFIPGRSASRIDPMVALRQE
jgi:ABC-type antimicrobial peptide transport system permease subunit